MTISRAWNRDRRTHALLDFCLAVLLLVSCANAVFVTFENCLESAIIDSDPKQLQFIPYWVDAVFNTTAPGKPLNLTIYGNVTGQATTGTYPAADDPSWTNPNDTFGKIVDVDSSTNRYTTLFQKYQFLSFNAIGEVASEFCQSTINDTCPLAPSFNGSIYNPYSLSAFTVQQKLDSSYAFATISVTISVDSGADGTPALACILANITPALGDRISGLIRYLPVVVLIFVGIATASAAILSPWGTSDPFKWTTNYGRDQDLLRLVTPGFNDCLQYVQFVFLTGCLSLSYPGYYQPAASQLGWSSLAFNESFVSNGAGYSPLEDNIYIVNATDGMASMAGYIGVSEVTDLWACMAVWLAVICAAAVLFCQLAFIARWIYFRVSETSEEDLRHKNWPLTGGMLVRVVFNYFMLPIVATTMFQLLIAPQSKSYVVIVAAILLVAIIFLAFWMLYILIRTKPRSHLFDDLPTLLLYGSLYNTYNDERAMFAIIPVILTFFRGLAIGAVQSTGIAQIILLAICEVLFIIALHAFRPFSSPTHMNVMHTIFATVRLITILLMVAFMPSLAIAESAKGWVGYIILLLHALVLVFGFFLNSIQTLIEVIARLLGAGGDGQHGAQRGALISYSWRQLQNRQPAKGPHRPGSMASEAIMLNGDAESKHPLDTRARSFSASSRLLLANKRESTTNSLNDLPSSPGVDSLLASSSNPTTPGIVGMRRISQMDPYYRPPRARRPTLESATPTTKRPSSRGANEWGQSYDEWEDVSPDLNPAPAFFRDAEQPPTDYAVREVDFYYGVTRGPALSSMPTRKRKTGPADPMGPVSNATSWFQRFVGGKKKDKGKGFEVVRSSRAPPQMMMEAEQGEELQTSPPGGYKPYHDRDELDPNIPEAGKTKRRMPLDGPWDMNDEEPETVELVDRSASPEHVLQPIERSRSLRMSWQGQDIDSPYLPRKSSKRHSRADSSDEMHPGFGGTTVGWVNGGLTRTSLMQGHAAEGTAGEIVSGGDLGERRMSID